MAASSDFAVTTRQPQLFSKPAHAIEHQFVVVDHHDELPML